VKTIELTDEYRQRMSMAIVNPAGTGYTEGRDYCRYYVDVERIDGGPTRFFVRIRVDSLEDQRRLGKHSVNAVIVNEDNTEPEYLILANGLATCEVDEQRWPSRIDWEWQH